MLNLAKISVKKLLTFLVKVSTISGRLANNFEISLIVFGITETINTPKIKTTEM